MSLFIKKPLEQLLAQSADSGKGLKRTLGPGNLIALGIGAIIGAGLFVRTAAAATAPPVRRDYAAGSYDCAAGASGTSSQRASTTLTPKHSHPLHNVWLG